MIQSLGKKHKYTLCNLCVEDLVFHMAMHAISCGARILVEEGSHINVKKKKIVLTREYNT